MRTDTRAHSTFLAVVVIAGVLLALAAALALLAPDGPILSAPELVEANRGIETTAAPPSFTPIMVAGLLAVVVGQLVSIARPTDAEGE